jgi:hypothetical protein
MSDGISKMYEKLNDAECSINKIVRSIGFEDIKTSQDILLAISSGRFGEVVLHKTKGEVHILALNNTSEVLEYTRLVMTGTDSHLGVWTYYII